MSMDEKGASTQGRMMMSGWRIITGVVSILTCIVGALSLIALLRHRFEFAFDSALLTVLEYHERLMDWLFGWAEPFIRATVAQVGWDRQLNPQWKHIFLLMWLYFGTHSRIAWNQGHWDSAVFNATSGGFIAFAGAVAGGVIPVTGPISSMLMPLFAVAGVVLYGLLNSVRAAIFYRNDDEPWLHAFREFSRHSARFAIFGGIVIAVGAIVGSRIDNDKLPALGLLVLFALYVCLAIYRIILGPRWGRHEPDKSGNMWQRTRRSGEAKIGFYMIYLTGGMVLFILLNSGLKFLVS